MPTVRPWARALTSLSMLSLGLVSATTGNVIAAAPASATTCGDGAYYYAGYADPSGTWGDTGVEGDINYPGSSSDISLSDDSTDHGNADITSYSNEDPLLTGYTSYNHDWLQMGYAVGSYSGDEPIGSPPEPPQSNYVQVYTEASWPGESNYDYEPKFTWYGDVNLGNDYFNTEYSGETSVDDGHTYGIYDGYYDYGSGYTAIGSSYLYYPDHTAVIAEIEGVNGESGSSCPDFIDGTDGGILYGTEGSNSDPQYDSDSIDRFQLTQGGGYVPWTYGWAETQDGGDVSSGPYAVCSNYDSWAAWLACGS